jgi:undecaprenyl-phosphate 4-deoxy-4-formamido-L-arabinose transferase
MTPPAPALSFVIPLYFSASTLRGVVKAIEALAVPGGHEIVLVNDGSRDDTAAIGRELLVEARVPITWVEHARNFGEHNAVVTGYRHARGAYIVNLDDDGQNPPAEAMRLYEHARTHELDVVYGHYALKRHAAWRNWGSRWTNQVTDWLLDKPSGFYLSSFRCVSAWVAREVAAHTGPFPYVDGLILQVTQRLGSLPVRHEPRTSGVSGYTFRRLLRLWLSTAVNFSVMPLRFSTLLGLVLAAGGFLSIGWVVYLRLTNQGPAFGWGALMASLALFSGVQLVMLGVIGEYLGRLFLTINGRPQSVVREVARSAREPVVAKVVELQSPAVGESANILSHRATS